MRYRTIVADPPWAYGKTTIRALMLAQQARHEGWTHPATKRTTCLVCGEEYPCADWVAADAALATLDAAERRGRGTRDARQSTDIIYVYDPPDPGVS